MLFADDKLANQGGTTADELELLDDVNGSGIFDAPGTQTVHVDMGVFADHPSVPGYIARHPPFQAQDEVTRGGRLTMEVPGSGVALVTYVNQPAPVPMQYPELYNTPLYPGATPMSGLGRIPYWDQRLPPGRAHYQFGHKQFIGDPTVPADNPEVPGSSLLPFVAGGLLIGIAGAIFFGTTGIDGRTPMNRNGRRRSRHGGRR